MLSFHHRILDNRIYSKFYNGKELTCVAICASEPPPIRFAVRFFVTATIPELSNNSLTSLCHKTYSSPSEYKFHFILHICDNTDEMDVYVPDEVAARFLQVKAKDLFDSRNGRSDRINKTLHSKVDNLMTKKIRLEGIITSKQVKSKKTEKKEHFYVFERLCVDDSSW